MVPSCVLRTGRIFCLVATHIIFFAVVICMNLLYFYNASYLRRVRAYLTMCWARTVCPILGVHVRREGHYRTIPCNFTVSNHVSYIDVLILAAMRPSVFIAKHEVKRWPLIGWLARLAGTIFIDRASKIAAWNALADIEKAVADNVNVVVFPEGTTTDGSGLLALRNFFFHVPAVRRMPIAPVSLRYLSLCSGAERKGHYNPSPVAWHGDATFTPHFWNLLGMRSIRAVLFFSPIINDIAAVSGHSPDRKLLALHAFKCIKDGLANGASLISKEFGGPLCKGRSGAFSEIQITEKTFVNELAD